MVRFIHNNIIRLSAEQPGMAEKTEFKREVERAEAAAYLREVADQLDTEGDISVAVGNKSVTLHPPKRIESEVEITERSSMLRKNHESIDISLTWKGGGSDG